MSDQTSNQPSKGRVRPGVNIMTVALLVFIALVLVAMLVSRIYLSGLVGVYDGLMDEAIQNEATKSAK